MPYDSDAQRKYFHVKEGKPKKEGGIPSKVVKEYDRASKGKKLPERVPSKKKPSK